MTTSRNYIIGLILAVSLLVAANVKADMVYNLNTFDASQWQVATLFQYGDKGYVNPTKDSKGNYNNATNITKFNEAWLDSAVYNTAVQGNRSTWVDTTNWVAAVYNEGSKVNNGYFAFTYTFTAADTTASSVAGTLNLNLGADDYIAAIYANGSLLYSRDVVNNQLVGDDNNKNGNWLSLASKEFNVDLIDGGLELMFVVHNTNAAGSASMNPMGLYVDGTLKTNITLLAPGETAPTPEPATLVLMGLGLAGLGLTRIRRRK